MNADKNPDTLMEVYNLKQAIKNKFINKVLNDQGLQTELTKVFKPITDSQQKS